MLVLLCSLMMGKHVRGLEYLRLPHDTADALPTSLDLLWALSFIAMAGAADLIGSTPPIASARPATPLQGQNQNRIVGDRAGRSGLAAELARTLQTPSVATRLATSSHVARHPRPPRWQHTG